MVSGAYCNNMKEIHGISEGSIVEVTAVAGSKAIDQSSDEWSGNLELGRDEIETWLQEGTKLEVRSIREPIRGNKVTITFAEVGSYNTAVSSTYESHKENDCPFDADGHNTKYSSKYFDVEVVE